MYFSDDEEPDPVFNAARRGVLFLLVLMALTGGLLLLGMLHMV